MPFLTQDDVQKLLKDPSETNRAHTVAQVSEVFKSRALEGRAATLVEEIIRIFAHDAAIRVRRAVSEQLQHDPDLPRDVALSLASDVDDVAIPILRFSRALSDDDLAELVASEGQEKLRAIAGRLEVGEKVSDAIIDHGDAETVALLIANGGSAPSEAGMLKAVDRFGDDDRVQTPLARRPDLPHTVMARMVAIVSDHVLNELRARPDLPQDLAADIIAQAEERVFLQLSEEEADPEELAARLQQMGRLTPQLAMRALVGGDMPFFEHAAARLAGMDVLAVRTIAYDAGALGARELCKRMGAAERLWPVFETGLATFAAIEMESDGFSRERFQARMIERMLSDFDDVVDHMEEGDVDALLTRLHA